jgi:hypothetical protein
MSEIAVLAIVVGVRFGIELAVRFRTGVALR